jgi:hypothetical protein
LNPFFGSVPAANHAMNPNPRLTKVIKGHPITDVENAHGTLTVRFENATWMRLRITLTDLLQFEKLSCWR